jgi:predicted esterase
VEPAPPAANSEPDWCAPELEVLPNEVCHYSAPQRDPERGRSLLIYLHGVIKPGTKWQWTQERGMIRHAKVHGLTVLVPRGRRGIGPKDMRDWWTWPTSSKAQRSVEDEVLEEWMDARRLLEKRYGAPFRKVYVLGFSNGAYYASSLALRGKLAVDGYAIIAGGSAKYHLRTARQVARRAPIYVGYGQKDSAGRDSQRLGYALRALRWPYKMVGRRGVGHTVTDSQVREALAFFSKS